MSNKGNEQSRDKSPVRKPSIPKGSIVEQFEKLANDTEFSFSNFKIPDIAVWADLTIQCMTARKIETQLLAKLSLGVQKHFKEIEKMGLPPDIEISTKLFVMCGSNPNWKVGEITTDSTPEYGVKIKSGASIALIGAFRFMVDGIPNGQTEILFADYSINTYCQSLHVWKILTKYFSMFKNMDSLVTAFEMLVPINTKKAFEQLMSYIETKVGFKGAHMMDTDVYAKFRFNRIVQVNLSQ